MSLDFEVNADTSNAQRNVQRLERNLESLRGGLDALKGAIAGLALGNFITQTIALGTQVNNLSKATDLSIASIRGFQQALSSSGGNSAQAADAISDLTKNIGEAAMGSGDLQNAFRRVGVGLEELRTLSNQEILNKVVSGLSLIPDRSARSAIAMKIFGEAVKTVDFTNVNKTMGMFAANSGGFSAAAASAAAAQNNIAKQIGNLQEALLEVIKPINDVASNINVSVNAFKQLITTVGNLAAVFLLLGPGLKLLNNIGNGIAVAGGAVTALNTVILGIFAGLNGFINNLLRMAGVLPSAYSGVQSLGFALVALSRALLRFAGLAGLIYLVVDAAIALEKAFFNTSYIEKTVNGIAIGLENLTRAAGSLLNLPTNLIGKLLGIDNPIGLGDPLVALANQAETARKKLESAAGAGRGGNAETTRLLQERGAALAKESQQIREVQDALKKQADAIRATSTEFKRLNNQQIATINFDKTLVGRSEDYIEVENARRAILTKAADETYKLGLAKAALTKDEQGLAGVYTQQIAAINKAAQADADRVADALSGLQGLRAVERARIADMESSFQMLEAGNNRQIALGEKLIDINQSIADVDFERSVRGLDPLQKQIAQIREENRKAALEAGRSFAAQFDGMDMTVNRSKQLADGLSAIGDRYKNLSDAQIRNLNESRTWNAGWKDAFNEYVDNATNAAMAAQNIFKVATKSMEDALVGLAKTGKFAWKDMLATMAEDLLRSQIRQLFASMMGGKSSGGSVILGALNSLGSVLGFRANGGPVMAGNPYIVGERGPELMIPNTNGTIVPNNALGGGTVVYNINAVDALSFKQMVARDPSFIHAVATQGGKSIPGTRR
jgi:lambda family phage tail tape measure protein